jgi:putative ABC transport system ATP-binding protein
MNPDFVLADEPTGNLDTQTGSEIMRLFTQLNNEDKITIVLVTHEPDIAKHARRQIIVRDGEILSDSKTSRKARKTDK